MLAGIGPSSCTGCVGLADPRQMGREKGRSYGPLSYGRAKEDPVELYQCVYPAGGSELIVAVSGC